MLEEIIANLGANYDEADAQVIQNLIDTVTTNALFISNRSRTDESIELLKFEIENCVITQYLQRGSEDVKNRSQSGLSSTFQNPYEELRKNIVRNGKRVIR